MKGNSGISEQEDYESTVQHNSTRGGRFYRPIETLSVETVKPSRYRVDSRMYVIIPTIRTLLELPLRLTFNQPFPPSISP